MYIEKRGNKIQDIYMIIKCYKMLSCYTNYVTMGLIIATTTSELSLPITLPYLIRSRPSLHSLFILVILSQSLFVCF